MLLAVDGEDPVAVLILEAEGDGQRLVVDAAVKLRRGIGRKASWRARVRRDMLFRLVQP